MTPTVPDGPDTELAAIVADLDDLHTEAASVAMRSEGSVTAAAEEVRDDVASIRDRLCAVLARPAAGRDLTAQDVEAAIRQWNVVPGEPHRDAFIANYLNEVARPAVARTDGQPSADEPRVAGRCPSCGRGSLRATAGGHVVCTRLECPSPTAADDLLHGGPPPGLVPADDTAVQGWGDVESADFIERARAATAVGSFTAQFDHVYDPSGNLVCESVDHSTAVRIAAALSGAPADDTAAPVERLGPNLRPVPLCGKCGRPDLPSHGRIAGWSSHDFAPVAGQPVRDSQPEATDG